MAGLEEAWAAPERRRSRDSQSGARGREAGVVREERRSGDERPWGRRKR